MSEANELQQLIHRAEEKWLDRWSAGPTEAAPSALKVGREAPDAELLDDSGEIRRLSEFWSQSKVLLMFWRHFGCGCGVMRSELLKQEWDKFRECGIRPIIIGQGEPIRAAAYKAEHGLAATILCDPDHATYRAYGIGHWKFQQIMLTDPPGEYLADPTGWGAAIQKERRATRPIVDDPWRATAEFLIDDEGIIRFAHQYEHCYDPPSADTIVEAAAAIGQ